MERIMKPHKIRENEGITKGILKKHKMRENIKENTYFKYKKNLTKVCFQKEYMGPVR